MATKFQNMDANESVFFLRQLEYVKQQSYDVIYEQLKCRTLIPVSFEAGPGAQSITYRQYDAVGMAKVIANYASDLPRADIKGKEFTSPVRSLGASYGYSIQDVRSAKQVGMPLEQRKANAAKLSILQKENYIAFFGDSANNLNGLFSHPNVPDVAIPADGTGSSTTFSSKSATQMLRDMNTVANSVPSQTNGIEAPDTMVMPLAQWSLIANTQMPNIDKTVLQFFLDNNPFIKNVEWCNECKGAGSGGTDIMMAYARNPDKVTLEIPQDYEQFPVQEKGLEYVVPCHERIGGIIYYYPLSGAKAHGI